MLADTHFLGQPTVQDINCPASLSPGASSATMLIFILPAAFYLKLVKKEPLRSPQKVGVSKPCNDPYCKYLNYLEEVRKHTWFRIMKQARPQNKQKPRAENGQPDSGEGEDF